MKRTLLTVAGAVAVAVLAFGATVAAQRYIELPWTNNIYKVSDRENRRPTVSVFDDAENKCYVVTGYGASMGDTVAISCVEPR